MKPLTEKPLESEQVMKFFTPELFLRFNSSDDDEADRANDDWEAAVLAYRTHLDGLHDQMPEQVRQIADLNLHDAEMLANDQRIEPVFALSPFQPFPVWSGSAILSFRHGDEIVSLIYSLWDRVRTHPARSDWPFSKQRTHWLYDELDLSSNSRGMFLHRVLLSDGTILEIPFVSALLHTFLLESRPRFHPSIQTA
jgi:hypothetical protein